MSNKLRHTRSKYKDAIQKGIDLLNEQVNDNWENKIDLERLNLDSTQSCVLGQLFGSYYEAMHELEIDGQGDRYGFEIIYNDRVDDQVNWKNLTNAWKREIEILRSKHIG